MSSHTGLLSVPVLIGAIAYLSLGPNKAPVAPLSSHADSVAVAKVVNEFQSALSIGDSSKALSLLTNDAVILESGGIEERSEYRSHHLPEDIKFAKAVASKRGPLHVSVGGSTAWTAATSTTKGTFNGRAIDSMGAESMVLTKQPAGWRIRSIHWSSRKRPASS